MLSTVKVLKFLTLYSLLFFSNFAVRAFKKNSGIANSIDPDQTAPSGFESELFAYNILSEPKV